MRNVKFTGIGKDSYTIWMIHLNTILKWKHLNKLRCKLMSKKRLNASNKCESLRRFFFTQLIIKYLIENRLHPFHSKSNGGDGRSRVRHWTETHMIWVYLLYFYKSYRLQWKSNWIWLGMDKNKAKQNKTKQIEKWFIKSSAFDG